ncbi:MAG: sulfide/dihydroorotate dehydrogenase-like FAD/NAD-binding protein [Deltaproteobacteria bacterium]|jgi:ferredoxin--NADP+ reductase|nr:sulfide/dihydroorotate dehydrogenase-like FAD/NAD-binding protein [Deltaproteobacteria bacterium]
MINTIIHKEILIPGKTSKMVVFSPEIARRARPGNFLMLRVTPTGERFPLTICDADPLEGTITIVFLVVGKSTALLETLNQGDKILDICGPLGRDTHIEKCGTVLCVGGGTGIAAMHHIAKGHAKAGNRVLSIIGAHSRDYLIMERELSSFSHNLLIATEDGSCGVKGFVTEILKPMLDNSSDLGEVIAVGPVPMMAAVSEMTRPYGLKTTVSLNSLMIDGLGMCGACRVTVGGQTLFTCVDGPEFDGHQVDFKSLNLRLSSFRDQEKISMSLFTSGSDAAHACEHCSPNMASPKLEPRKETPSS